MTTLEAIESAKAAVIAADSAGSDMAQYHARKDAVEALRGLIVAYEYVVNYGVQMSTESYYEYGYRIVAGGPDGEPVDVWPEDYGPDGSWTPEKPEWDMDSINMLFRPELDELSVRKAIEAAEIDGVVIRRKVTTTRDETEEIAFIPAKEYPRDESGEEA